MIALYYLNLKEGERPLSYPTLTFEFGQQEKTVITKEYPANWQKGDEPYYPVQTPENAALYQKYCQLAKNYPNVIFGGRLGMYQYFDMHKVIEAALNVAKQELAQ